MTESKKGKSIITGRASLEHRAARTWVKIVVRADSRMTEAVAAYLADISTGGIEISASVPKNFPSGNGVDATTEEITAYIPVILNEPDKETGSRITDLKHFLSTLSRFFPECAPPDFMTEIIKEEDWGKIWKSFFSSFQVTPKLTIKPSWEKTDQQSRDTNDEHFVIEMDPGLAFGTGHHASTRLALSLLEGLFLENTKRLAKVLDVGTGSGILAMGCALFGAQKVLAIDNDPDAVETAKRNISRNRLEHIITVSSEDVASVSPEFNLITANITHDTLAEMAEVLDGLIAPQGYLVLSGILKGGQENSICDIYTGHGMRIMKVLSEDEWTALLLQKD